jgi:hypothetical protein
MACNCLDSMGSVRSPRSSAMQHLAKGAMPLGGQGAAGV